MDYDMNSPIYLQVIDQIKKKIITGELIPGRKLPSTRELAYEFEINPNTAARVYSEMEAMGLSFTKRGLGTFLTEDKELIESLSKEKINSLVSGFVSDMRLHGYNLEETKKMIEGAWKYD